jgi:hypothetical protein
MTDQERQAYAKALMREREGYVRAGDDERVAGVDAELRRIGADGTPPSQRASRRPAKGASEARA